MNNTLTISGKQSVVKTSINLPADLQIGNYDITTDGDQNVTYPEAGNRKNTTNRFLTIDIFTDGQISGNFAFTIKNRLEIRIGNYKLIP